MAMICSRCEETIVVRTSYKVSAPGTLMLLGEHAVLWNKVAVVTAINQRLSVTLKPRSDRKIKIVSELGSLETTLETISLKAPFQFILAAILQLRNELQGGFDLIVESQFSHLIGLGSSAAVTVATVAVLMQFGQSFSKKDVFENARQVIRTVQGMGSGADVAASVYGNVVVYRSGLEAGSPYQIETLNSLIPLIVLYSGSKKPTSEVIAFVEQKRKKHALIFEALYNSIEDCSKAGIEAIKLKNWAALGEILNIHQGLMCALGVSTPCLNQLIDRLRQESFVWGAKISGSGMGDCIVGIGECAPDFFPEQIPVQISKEGLRDE